MDGSGRDLRSLRAASPYAQTGYVYRTEPLTSRVFRFLSSASALVVGRVLAGFSLLPKGFGSSLTVALFVGTAVILMRLWRPMASHVASLRGS